MQRVILLACVLGLMLTCTISAKPAPKRDPMPALAKTTRVVMETSHGRIVIELNAEKAPITVKNFLHYVDDGFYNGTIFHRVIPDFMIQGGGHVPGLKEKPGHPPIQNESANGLSNERGAIAAARTADPNSATSQFFINTKDNKSLDRANASDQVGYCVFGKIVEGMDIVDVIRQVPTHLVGGHANVPVQDVTIRSVRRLAN